MLLPFRLRRFISRHFISYDSVPLKGYDFAKHIPLRNKKGSFLIEKKTLLSKNIQNFTFVIISDSAYFCLVQEQIQSIMMVEPGAEIFIFDIGLRKYQKDKLAPFQKNVTVVSYDFESLLKKHNFRHDEGAYFLKIIAVTETMKLTKNKKIIFSDAANLFLKPLNSLKNFIETYGFYAGMTSTYLNERVQQFQEFRNIAEETGVNIFDKKFFLIESGLWAMDLSHQWTIEFLREFYSLSTAHDEVYHIFPHEMVIMSCLLAKYLVHKNIVMSELPNIRFAAVIDKRKDIEKNMVVYDYATEKIPFFGYVCHNFSKDPDAPEKRRSEAHKADIKEYMHN